MRAVVLQAFGGPEQLVPGEVDDPSPGPGEVRVAVEVVVVARTKDVSARAGLPPFGRVITPPHVLGTECAGTVDEVGPGGDQALLGARVAVSAVLSCGTCRACDDRHEEACERFALVGVHRQGSYAELVVVPAGNVHVLPDDVGATQAAALAANGPVARAQLDAGGVGEGSNVVVLGAGGALGSAAAALAAHRGADVIGVEHLARKRDVLDALPLRAVLEGDDADLAQQILTATGGRGADCVVDNLGLADLWARYVPGLADRGRVVVSGALGHEPLAVDVRSLYLRSQSLIGVRTGNRDQVAALWRDVHDGFRLPDALVTTLPWEEAARAHADVEAHRAVGQLVLTLD